jgi:hypothetical protein
MHRIAAVALLAALLSGCFASDQPLFSSESAVLALGNGGRYATFEIRDEKENPSDPVEVRPGPENVYEFINEKGAVTPITFHHLAGDEHVVQAKLAGTQGYGYMLAQIRDKDVLVVPIECNKQDGARMAALGIVRRTEYECRIEKLPDLLGFFRELKRSEPSGRMVPQ